MKREDFKKIIKLRSVWKISKKEGNYKLPNGKYLKDYVLHLVESQMEVDELGIAASGDLYLTSGGGWNDSKKEFDEYIVVPDFAPNEKCSYDEMEKRIRSLVNEIVQ